MTDNPATRSTEEAVQLLLPRLARFLPGLCADLAGLSFVEVTGPGDGWHAGTDVLEVAAWNHPESLYRYLSITETLGHELWHRRSVQSLFWATPAGRWWFGQMAPEAREYLDECRGGLLPGHDEEYIFQPRPDAGMPTPLHRAAEELLAERCGYAASRWMESCFRGRPRPVAHARRGLPGLATRTG